MFRWYRSLKYSLLGFALCVVTGIVYIVQESENEYTASAIPPLVSQQNTQNEALKPRFQATNEKGQPYTIQADTAVMRESDGIIVLSLPFYMIHLKNDNQVKITALKGFLNQEKKKLILDGNVVVTYGKDMTVNMPSAHIDLSEGDVFGDKSIQIMGERVRIEAGSFEICHRGDTIVLTDKPVLMFRVKGK